MADPYFRSPEPKAGHRTEAQRKREEWKAELDEQVRVQRARKGASPRSIRKRQRELQKQQRRHAEDELISGPFLEPLQRRASDTNTFGTHGAPPGAVDDPSFNGGRGVNATYSGGAPVVTSGPMAAHNLGYGGGAPDSPRKEFPSNHHHNSRLAAGAGEGSYFPSGGGDKEVAQVNTHCLDFQRSRKEVKQVK